MPRAFQIFFITSKVTVFNNFLCKITKCLGANIFWFKFLEEIVIVKEAETLGKPEEKTLYKRELQRKVENDMKHLRSNDVIVYTA